MVVVMMIMVVSKIGVCLMLIVVELSREVI